MAGEQKHSGKNQARGARLMARTKAERVNKINRSRKRHLKNATRSCGVKFANQLKASYDRVPPANVPTKHGKLKG